MSGVTYDNNGTTGKSLIFQFIGVGETTATEIPRPPTAGAPTKRRRRYRGRHRA